MAALYRTVFEQIIKLTNDIIIVTEASPLSNQGPKIVYANNAFSDLTGYTVHEVIGKSPRLLQGPDTDPETKGRIRDALLRQEPVREIILNYGKAGNPYWLDINIIPLRDSSGVVTHFAAIERDVTELKRTEDELQYKAMHDGLTALLNRTAFMENAAAEFARSRRHGRSLCLIALDIDHFKKVNDVYGHQAGDEVLRQYGSVMKDFGRGSDSAGRMGGEEFAVLLPETTLDSAVQLAEGLRSKLAELSFSVTGANFNVTSSMGVTCMTADDESIDRMADRADQALYRSKNAGRDCMTVFGPTDVKSAA